MNRMAMIRLIVADRAAPIAEGAGFGPKLSDVADTMNHLRQFGSTKDGGGTPIDELRARRRHSLIGAVRRMALSERFCFVRCVSASSTM